VLGYPSCFKYCLGELGLSESQTSAYLRVARVCKEIPAVKKKIDLGSLTVSKVKRMASVINESNQESWIEKAETLSQKELEREVVKENPRERVFDRVVLLDDEFDAIHGTIRKETSLKKERVAELIAQKTGKPCDLEGLLSVVFEQYLERHDPVRKAERATKRRGLMSSLARKSTFLRNVRKNRSAALNHELALRDRGQCVYIDEFGRRCDSRQWLDVHHVLPVSKGGADEISNLITLCWGHHRMRH